MRLASRGAFETALQSAHDVTLCAYTLAPDGPIARALEAAADRGARVAVRLEGHPTFGHATSDAAPGRDPAAIARALSAHGVCVTLTGPGDPPAHLKAAVVDGVAYLDDRNWAARGAETIVSDDDAADVAAIESAIVGRPAVARGVALEKATALALEATAIAASPCDAIEVASESFGGSVVSAALRDRARAGARVRLEVDARVLAADRTGRERTLLEHLAADGVEIRAVAADAKVAICGERAWVGSANATFAPGPMSDWGAAIVDRDDVRQLSVAFERAWRTGVPIARVRPELRACGL